MDDKEQGTRMIQNISNKMLEIIKDGVDPHLFSSALLLFAVKSAYALGIGEDTVIMCVKKFFDDEKRGVN
jgi:hypothetical protein